MPMPDISMLAPLAKLALVALALALLPLAWWWWRHRGATAQGRLAALTAITLFLTFDLIVFGAFTRLSDSGLGCPDWPGCYGQASPLAAHGDIQAAQTALPSGPVTQAKAWIEMLHRYLAMAVGLLIVVGVALAWRLRQRLPRVTFWSVLLLAWVIMQGLFGKYTVTLKLYPAVVTLHLLGGMILLALLVAQLARLQPRPLGWPTPPPRAAVWAVGGVLLLQIALGGWVSTNYAVLACTGFPACNGQWWPAMDLGHGFTLLRELGRASHGGYLAFDALVAIHMVHRLFAVVALTALLWLSAMLWRAGAPGARRAAGALLALCLLQLASGLSNVVLGWPLLGALMHSGGAAALVAVVVAVAVRLPGRAAVQVRSGLAGDPLRNA